MRLSDRWRDPAVVAEAAAAWRARPNLRLTDLLADDAIAALHDAVAALPHPLRGARGARLRLPVRRGRQPTRGRLRSRVVPVRALVVDRGRRAGVGDHRARAGAARRSRAHVDAVSPRLVPRSAQRSRRRPRDRLRRRPDPRVVARRARRPPRVPRRRATAQVVVTERRAPGWNTLDLFDVVGTNRLHQVSDRHRRRRAARDPRLVLRAVSRGAAR
jgi:hypothetical protein